MRNLVNKLLGKTEQGHEAPVTTAIVFTAETNTKAPDRLMDITQIIDDEAVKANVDKFKAEGEVMAGSVSKNSEYEFDIDGKPPVLKELHVLATKTISLCESLVSFAKAPYTNYRKELEALLSIETEEERKDAFLKQNGEAITCEVSEAEKSLIEVTAKEEQMRNARNKKEEAADKRKKISKEQYGGHPVDKRAIPLWLYLLILVAILPPETMLNVGALDAIESDLQSWFVLPTAMTITGMIALSAHFLGVFVGNKSHKGLIAVAVGAAVMMLGIVFFLRANGIQSAFVLTFINLAAFLLMSGLSYIYHKDEAYFKADEAHTKWRDAEGDLQREIETIQKTAKDSVSGIYDRWNAKAAKAVEKEVKPLKLEILRLIREEEAFDSYFKTHILDPVNAMYHDFITRAEINFIKARKRNGLPVVTPEPIDKPVEEAIETYEAESEEKFIPDLKMNGHHNGNGLGRLEDFQKGFYSFLMGLFLFGVSACTNEDVPPQHTDIVVIGDASISQKDSVSLPTPEQQLSFILGSIDFTPYDDRLSVTRDHIRVQVTHIGETSFPPIQTIELEEGEPLWSMVKSKRRTAQEAFIENARKAIKEHTQPKGLASSHVFDCFCHVLPPMIKSDADIKHVFLMSDLLEHSDIDDFYTLYARMPGKFETIKDRFETHCPALKEASLSGIHFTAVYLPDEKRDKSTRHARMFWEMYIQSKGGVIEFMPNLPDVKSMQIAHH
jgi:hypothetical protein